MTTKKRALTVLIGIFLILISLFLPDSIISIKAVVYLVGILTMGSGLLALTTSIKFRNFFECIFAIVGCISAILFFAAVTCWIVFY
jgi:hypothetical protein